jgi:hypothetical protein
MRPWKCTYALVLAIAALLPISAAAQAAAPTNLVVTQSDRVVKASWTLPAPPPQMQTGYLEFSPTLATDEWGFFSDEAAIWYQIDGSDTTFDSSPTQFDPGTYYVHISAYDPTTCSPQNYSCTDEFSTPLVVLVVPPDAGPPPPPPVLIPTSALPPLPDTVTAFAGLSARKSQKVGKLLVRAAMGEAGTITAGGTVNVPKLAKVYRFKTVSAPAVAGASVTLRLRLPAKALRAVRKALARRKKLSAKITITARDTAGNKKTERRTIKLRL